MKTLLALSILALADCTVNGQDVGFSGNLSLYWHSPSGDGASHELVASVGRDNPLYVSRWAPNDARAYVIARGDPLVLRLAVGGSAGAVSPPPSPWYSGYSVAASGFYSDTFWCDRSAERAEQPMIMTLFFRTSGKYLADAGGESAFGELQARWSVDVRTGDDVFGFQRSYTRLAHPDTPDQLRFHSFDTADLVSVELPYLWRERVDFTIACDLMASGESLASDFVRTSPNFFEDSGMAYAGMTLRDASGAFVEGYATHSVSGLAYGFAPVPEPAVFGQLAAGVLAFGMILRAWRLRSRGERQTR